MYLIRDLMHCKPGKVRPLIEKSVAMSKLLEKYGAGKMRVTTDFAGEQFWTIAMEFEVKDLQELEDVMAGKGQSEAMMKEMETLMKGYHEFVERGRREIWKIEG